MTVPYIDLFNLAYSTTISESVKEEIINHIELPLTEAAFEISDSAYESIVFLDSMAYSDMSEAVVNELIDRVFQGCNEEYLEEVYEAYIRVKALAYVCEDDSPESWNPKTYKKNITTPRAIKELEDKAKARQQGNFLSKAKEGIKNAVGKVKNWWDRQTGKSTPRYYKSATNPSKTASQNIPATAQPKANAQTSSKPTLSSNDFGHFKYGKKPAETPKENKPSTRHEKVEQLSFLTPSGEIKDEYKQKKSDKLGAYKGMTNAGVSRKEALRSVGAKLSNFKDNLKKSSLINPKKDKVEASTPKGSNEVIDNASTGGSTGGAEPNRVTNANGEASKGGEESKPKRLRPGQLENESLKAFYKRMKAEGKAYNKKTRTYEPIKKEIEASANGEGNNNEPSSPSATATITEPKKEEKVSEAPADTAQDTSTDSKEQTSTSDTAETVVGTGGKIGNNKQNDSSSNEDEKKNK